MEVKECEEKRHVDGIKGEETKRDERKGKKISERE